MDTEQIELPRDGDQSPYKNLWMPLVVVPGLIVIVLVLVFLAFGGIGGSEPSIADNLQDVMTGGKNERTQAAFMLSQKVSANSAAQLDGDPLPFPLPEDMTERVGEALRSTASEEYRTRFVLASLLAQLGDRDGVPGLLEVLGMPDSADPERELRFDVLVTLGTFGDARAVGPVVAYAEHPDHGLRSVVAIVLQKLSGPQVEPTLIGLLGDTELEVRANAAISLAKLGNAAGAGVLRSLLETEVYTLEHGRDERRFRSAEVVSRSRRKALSALARLGRSEDRAGVEGYREDPDLEFRAVVLDALASWGAE
jgi:HEAT repeat protein